MNNTSLSFYSANEGKIASFIIPVVFLGISALISFVIYWPLGLLFTILATGLGLAETGYEIDINSCQHRKFNKIFGYKIGNWKQLTPEGYFHLILSVDTTNYSRLFPISSSLYGTTKAQSKSITYNLIFSQKDGMHQIAYEFASYKVLLGVARFILETGQYEVVDHIALKMEENRKKRGY